MSERALVNTDNRSAHRGGQRKNWHSNFSRGRYFRGRYNGNVQRKPNSSENSQLQHCYAGIVVGGNPQDGPYMGWKLYLTDEEYVKNSITENKLKLIHDYFMKNREVLKLEDIEARCFFTVDIKNVTSDNDFTDGWQDFLSDLKNFPEKVISYFGLAMHHLLVNERKQQTHSLVTDVEESLPMIHARFVNFEPVTLLKNLKANAYGKYVSVKGTVVRVSNVKPVCTKMAFQCIICSSVCIVLQPFGKYTVPSSCSMTNCYSRSFLPLRRSPFTETIDWQGIRLQESMTDEQRESGRVPRIVECELMNDLVDNCIPGDIVTLSGIVKVSTNSDGKWNSNKDKSMFILHILANSITSLRQNTKTSSVTPAGLELSLKDLYAVQAIEAEKNLFRLIVASLCPSIYGHEMVKAGLVLGLFGGKHRFLEDSNRIPVRGDPHVLIVGDPGLGKSQMLQACSNIAPRGVYVCGNTTTSSGLTVTLVKEAGGEYALEAGALVLADQGCCCIDEFDKMSNQHHALLEAMEQQTISIAKGGIVCSLPARTSILAAANPVGGHYNKAKTVSENLKLGSALLSRFDLVFILLDKPDEELDNRLSEHVIGLHSRQRELSSQPPLKKSKNNSDSSCSRDTSLISENNISIKEKLKFKSQEECDPIPHQLLRKYIAYARKYVHPQLSAEAAKVLQKFYLDLRKQHKSQDSTPITTRQLESLIRLTEARARLELREVCTADDAQDIVDIMKYSILDTYSDEFGELDFQRSAHGSGMSSRSLPKKFIKALTKVAERTNNKFFTVQHMRQVAKDVGIEIVGFEEFITSLNNQGFLLKKESKLYQLQTYE